MPAGSTTIDGARRAAEAEAHRQALERWRRWLMEESAGPEADHRGPAPSRRVLLISYMFPPTGGATLQRPAKLAAYLPDCGWSVEVVTASHDRFAWYDATMEDNAGGGVHRIRGWEPACLAGRIASLFRLHTGTDARHHARVEVGRQGRRPTSRFEDALHWRLTALAERLGLGDGSGLWQGPAFRAALRLHRARPFDAVVSTGPPHFVHRIAARLADAAGLPWVADLRDPLVSDFERGPADRRQDRASADLERMILRRARIVVTTCPALRDDLLARYPDRAPSTVCCVTNGFDRRDLRPLLDDPAVTPPRTDRCLLACVGSLYGRRELSGIAGPLDRVLAARPDWAGKVRLIVAGTIDRRQQRDWKGRAPAWLTFAGYLDHRQALALAAGAACNLVIVPDCMHGRLSVPGKTFELLALPPHVLGLVPPHSDTARILRQAGGTTIVPFEDSQAVAGALERIIDAHLAGRLMPDRHWPAVEAYDRRRVARRFAACLGAAFRPAARDCVRDARPAGR